MKPPIKTRRMAAGVAVALALFPAIGTAQDALAGGFSNPPDSAKPHTWWHWVDGNVTQEGIVKDLEAMREIGLGGFQMFHVGGYGPEGPVKYMSPGWQELVNLSIREADRLGLEVTLHNSAGWANSGGPWITPDEAMKTTVWSETPVKGGGTVETTLPQPMTRRGYYRDIAVLAVPESPSCGNALVHLRPMISGSNRKFDGQPLIDGDWDTTPKGKQKYIQVEFAEPFTALSIRFVFNGLVSSKARIRLETSNDGDAFTPVGQVFDTTLSRSSGSRNIAPVTARFFRIVPDGLATDQISELSLSGAPVVDSFGARAGYCRAEGTCPPMTEIAPDTSYIAAGDVVDLTDHLANDGTIRWQAPPGDWMLIRIGYTLTGKENRPAPPEGRGLECDKLSRPALKKHFDHVLGKVIQDAGPLAGKSLVAGLIDSFEVGSQNWTPEMPGDFRERTGYDIGSHLLALTGRIVDSPEKTDRFLNDFRRVIAGLFSDNYFGYFDELCAEHGLESYAEGYGDGNFEFLTASRHADIPMTEFWFDRGARSFRNEWIKTVTSVAHAYDKPVVAAESFTSDPNATRPWGEHPGAVKRFGDLAYSLGINRFILHTFTHQPWPDEVVPGMTMGRWGGHFDRTETWWRMGSAWMRYMSRCQYLLQQGSYVADVAVYTGEDRPGSYQPPELPAGVNYDYLSDEALLDQTTAANGKLTLRSGSSYRVLVLPDDVRMSTRVARKLGEIVDGGVIVTGPRPEQPWGLLDTKAELDSVTGRYWKNVLPNLSSAVAAAGIRPDFSFTGPDNLCFIHKRIAGVDAYFIANQTDRRIAPECGFRVSGKLPERWDPMTGDRFEPALFQTFPEQGLTSLVLPLEPYESTFVIFRKSGHPVVTQASVDGKDINALEENRPSLRRRGDEITLEASSGGIYSVELADGTEHRLDIPVFKPPVTLDGSWNVAFDPRWKAPASIRFDNLHPWNESEDETIRYYSGTATYTKDFRFDRDPLDGERFHLDLGEVHEMARVRLNGNDLGILWIKPFRIDVTGSIKTGSNRLEIEVANLWPNRLIGDEHLPDDRGKDWKETPEWFDHFSSTGERPSSGRMTYANWKHFEKDSPLSPSGLLGPVTIHSSVIKTVTPISAGETDDDENPPH